MKFWIPALVISYAMFAFGLVIILLTKRGEEEDNNFRRKKALGKETVKADYKNVDTTFYDRVVKPMLDKINNTERYGENATKSERQKKNRELLAAKLRKAGMHISVSNYTFFKTAFSAVVIVLSIGISLILFIYGMIKPALFVVIVGILFGILAPDLYLSLKVKKHQEAIKMQLADTIDLLSVCMEAGLSFDASLVKVAERMDGPLIDELMTVFRQIQLGKNRNDALKSIADASDVKELKTFVSAVTQAGQLGIPITNVLQAQAEQLRLDKSEEIKEVASKVPTKMTIPTVIFILPAFVLVIIGPVIIQVIDVVKESFG
ncbi:MAG: type II secretion system F family protein [Ruminococcaceae bacterium]|nr:type II secretion system F family protein [Oscillospiraceae bacterium]